MEANWAVQSRVVDMYDVCAYVHVDKTTLTLTTRGHPVAKINKVALSTLAGHLCNLCPETFA